MTQEMISSVDAGMKCDSKYDKLHADGRQDWMFEIVGDLWMNGNMLMQNWFFYVGNHGWRGWDVIILNQDGKVEVLHGLVEGMHNHSTWHISWLDTYYPLRLNLKSSVALYSFNPQRQSVYVSRETMAKICNCYDGLSSSRQMLPSLYFYVPPP